MKPLFEAPAEATCPASAPDAALRPPDYTRLVEEHDTASVVTRMKFAAPPEEVWEGLMFYEQIGKRQPLLLRLFLPVPIRTEGRKSEAGDEVKCHYLGGHLIKRMTHVTRGRSYEFEVIEQNLAVGGGIRLLGGCYTLHELPGGHTRLSLKTRYVSHRRPRWLCQMIEAAVCHSFHRYIMNALRKNLQSR